MPNGNYEWNCLAYDSADNLNWGDDNWSLTVDHCACLNCTECIQKLNNPACSIVYLNTDITNHPGTCINNPENFTNKTFDCQGYMIDGSGSGSGIYLDGKENNTIRNCVITGFGYGFYLNNSDSNDLINNTANSNNNYDGFYLYYSDSNNLINNTAKRNNRYGFYLYYSDTNTLNGNLVCANEKDIRVRKATGNTGDNNTCQQTQGWNDEGTTGCTYECTADLTILEIVPIGSLIECENMTVNATVKNVGGRDANNYDLSLYKNDNLVEIRTNLPSLAIGATHTETYALNDSYTCACDIWGHTGLNFNLKASITGVAPEEGITENNNKTGAVALVNILEIIPEETTITVSTNATYIIQPHQIINNSDIMGIENISIEYINDTLPASCTNITPDFFSAIPPSNFNFTVNIPCLSNGTSNGTKVTSGFDENGFCVENDTKPVQVTKNESAAVVVCGIVDFGTICTGQGNSTNIKIKNGDSTYYVQNVSYEFPDLADNGNTIPGDQMNASTPLPIPPGTNITSVINITIALNQTPGTYNGTGDVTIGFNNSPQTLILFSLPTQVTVYDCVPPTIINVTDYPDPQNMTGILNITANVSDNIEVSTVLVEITYPDGTIINYTMTKTLPEDGIWYLEFDDTDLQGIYNYTVYVNDTSNNIVNSLKYNFTIGMLNVALDSPGNGSTDTDGNITFTCNVTGVNQLKNITLYTWNSTGVYYTNTTNISGTSNQSIWNVTEIQDGNYTWNCLAYDSADDYDWGDANWSLNIAVPPTVTLISPPNNTLETSNNTIVFRYNVTDSSDMANCSLIINNAVEKTDDTITKDVEQNFTKTLSNGNYNWSVNCTDVYGNEGSSEVRNLSVNVAADVTPPIIYLMSPANDSKTTDNTPDFTFNATDDAATQMNCTLYINGTAYGTNNSVQNNTETTITANSTLDDGTYSWWINCSDGSLTNISETWSFTTDTIPPTINFTSPTPQNNSNLPQNYIPANATAQDPNLANITIYLYNSTDLVTSNTSSTSPFFWNITGLSDGTYYLNATANDTAGNKNSTETRNHIVCLGLNGGRILQKYKRHFGNVKSIKLESD
ncbi:MAG: hypothetical protein A7315_00720 [Candidatus Altiarchaeales archaeon WOR_SM1_79]|nr:MAG: hypothetical protein A7315_00720 [Candidatus Altiarchaeales archaeon WOR_SM1_79]